MGIMDPENKNRWGTDKELGEVAAPKWNGALPFTHPRMVYLTMPLLEEYPSPHSSHWKTWLGQHQLQAFKHFLVRAGSLGILVLIEGSWNHLLFFSSVISMSLNRGPWSSQARI
jgi:hypothetical protein